MSAELFPLRPDDRRPPASRQGTEKSVAGAAKDVDPKDDFEA